MKNGNDEGFNAFQTFSTLLALLLPIVQFFFNTLSSSTPKVIVFGDLLGVVSIIAGVVSYLLIIAFKNMTWFKVTFRFRAHRSYQKYSDEVALVSREEDESKRNTLAKGLLKKVKHPPFYLTPLNIYYLLIPLLATCILSFLAFGIFNEATKEKLPIFLQSITYIFSIALTSLTLAVFYINETNLRNEQRLNREKYKKIIQLLFDNNSIPEFPNIQFVAQIPKSDYSELATYIKVNSHTIYEVTTDARGDILKQVIENSGSQGAQT